MFGSQALEALIGLSLLFFILAFAASSAVEAISQLVNKRSKELERVLGQLFAPEPPKTIADLSDEEKKALNLEAAAASTDLTADQVNKIVTQRATAHLSAFQGTSVWTAAVAGAKRAAPSYLSARAFADGVIEAYHTGEASLNDLVSKLPPVLKSRIAPVVAHAEGAERHLLVEIKSSLEQLYDAAMNRLAGAYKRWSRVLLFAIGLFLAVAANASAFHVADRLWKEPATRDAVSNAAGQITNGHPDDLKSVGATTSKLQELALPVGWDQSSKDVFTGEHAIKWWQAAGLVLGWLATGLLVSLGAPFWFDLLMKLTSLRAAGNKPPTAANDPTSATSVKLAGIAASVVSGPAAQPETVAPPTEPAKKRVPRRGPTGPNGPR